MLYLESRPSLPLAGFIRSLWYTSARDLSHRRERVLPNGCAQIVISLATDALTNCGDEADEKSRAAEMLGIGRPMAAAVLVGARGRYDVIDTGDLAELVGIVIRPGGLGPWLRQPANAFFEQSIELDDLWNTQDLRTRLQQEQTPEQKLARLDSLLVESLGGRRVECRCLVKQALPLLAQKGVRGTAQVLGVSERRIQQVFNEGCGPFTKALEPRPTLSASC